jgi:hypothetical protein
MTSATATKPRYNPDVFHEQSLSPIADLHLEVVFLQRRFLHAQARLAEEVAVNANLQARLNRVSGALSELTQRLELGDKRAKKTKAPGQGGDSSADLRD